MLQRNNVNLDSESSVDRMLLTAREAAERLGIKLDTLYAYVSRGRLQSVAVPGSRERRYRGEKIDALGTARGAPGLASAEPSALPPIDSSICLIEDGRLYYRGLDAVRLSDTATLEDVAALLWEEAASDPPSPRLRGEGRGERPLSLIERCQTSLAILASVDPAASDLSRGAIARAGRVILDALTSCVAGNAAGGGPVHRRLGRAWRLDPTGADLVRRILVLLADHEFNASTFAARVVASTGASPYTAVSAALGALSGRRHGGLAARTEAMFREVASGGDPIDAIAERLHRGEILPGFGHPLYPRGDPRAVAILYALSLVAPQARRLVGRQPNVDFALGAASVALGLPPGSALGLFVVARSVGWIAHAIEQHESGVLIRPRARYTGKRVAGGDTA
jgi:citrate synthase